MIRLVDLSQDLYGGMQVYPGHLKSVTFHHVPHPKTAQRFTSGFSFQTWGLMLNDIGPTHVDSFSRVGPEPYAESIDQIALEVFYGSATCPDGPGAAPRTDIESADLDRAFAASGIVLNPGDTCFNTGDRERHAGANPYLTNFPGHGGSAAEWIVDHGVKNVHHRRADAQRPGQHGLPDPHDVPARAQYPPREPGPRRDTKPPVTSAGSPRKVVRAHGGPTRAVALLDD